MNLLNAIKISSTGLSAERVRLNVASMNLANAHVTRTIDGGPYKARSVIFSSVPFTNPESELGELENDGFAQQLARALQTVKVSKIVEDSGPFKEIHDPSHPDADKQGMVLLPNVNVMEQMVDIMTAARAFEANITAIDTAKSMAMKAIEIAR